MSEDKSENKEVLKSEVAKKEEEILKFWQDNNIFKKTLDKKSPKGDFVFYDGPPFATGMPHYGHIVPGTMKDVIPRYKTMRGYRVERRWGWDTQGVPIEAIVQKENNLQTKKDIEEFGILNFNNSAKKEIFRFADNWKEVIPRTGRFVDFDDLYITMSAQYAQSIWWMWKELYKKGLVYEGFKSMHVSPPLETALSNFEVNQGYKDITDLSATVKFKLLDADRSGDNSGDTFVLAWTTTPWTLPGNVALAVGKDIEYVEVAFENEKYILAKDLIEKVFYKKVENDEVKLAELKKSAEKISASDLIGKKYQPPFDYYQNSELKNIENGWKIYEADFVTTEDGTGIVHIAPAFGEDDLKLGQKYNLPFIQHVEINGKIKSEVTDFAGLDAKPKDDPSRTDVEFIKNLAGKNLLFSKEKYTHSYPHCYRTDAPLLNYAMSSWFIKVTDFKDKLVSENNKVNWVPNFVGQNRFGNWLKDAKDWAVSRSRFWGTSIPVWKSDDNSEICVIGSIAELREKTQSQNKYFVMRHGEADHNVNNVLNCTNENPSHLTKEGKEEAGKAAQNLKKKAGANKIDFIISSPLTRTLETAEIVAKELGLDSSKIITDERITEVQTGVLNNQPIDKYRSFFNSREDRFISAPSGGENLTQMKNRIGDFIYDIDSKEEYKGKNILIITHEYVTWLIDSVAHGYDIEQTLEQKALKEDYVKTGEFMELDFAKLPVNENYELDLHRPYIDEITFTQNGKLLKRIPDVFDTWIDSGSVPYASFGYPMNKDRSNPNPGLFQKSKNYPADFIAEGLDQTRGWFYSMLVLNTALFGKAPYKNVLVNGLLLAEDGRKMSKRLKNYPPLDDVLNNYGADALRYFLMASPIVRAEEMLFSEKGVDEVMKKLVFRLNNIVSFYEMYKGEGEVVESNQSQNILDKWILSKLSELESTISKSLDKYEIDRAARPIMEFIDELSTWYVRRSRDRFKEEGDDKEDALRTTKFVVLNLSKLIAPFVPFIAESIYQKIGGKMESVHLEIWPDDLYKVDKNILEDMKQAREIVTWSLEARDKAGIKVRQPLNLLKVKSKELSGDFVEIIKDEVNILDLKFVNELSNSSEFGTAEFVELDTNMTPELECMGDMRELIRFIQNLRKNLKLEPGDKINLSVSENLKDLFEEFPEIKSKTNISEVKFDLTEGEKLELNLGEVFVGVMR